MAGIIGMRASHLTELVLEVVSSPREIGMAAEDVL